MSDGLRLKLACGFPTAAVLAISLLLYFSPDSLNNSKSTLGIVMLPALAGMLSCSYLADALRRHGDRITQLEKETSGVGNERN